MLPFWQSGLNLLGKKRFVKLNYFTLLLLNTLINSLFFHQPNANEVHIDPIDIKEVWNLYKTDTVVASEEKVYGYEAFTKIWRDVFPKVKIREYKNVTGKCEVCDACKNLMASSKSKALRIVVRQYKLMHRSFYSYYIIKEEQRLKIAIMARSVV